MRYIPHAKIPKRYHIALDGRMASLCGKEPVGEIVLDALDLPAGVTVCRKCRLCLEARRQRGDHV